MSFTDLNLDPRLLRAIEASGFTAPTDIQRQAIPVALAGRDIMASAQTGTGKTAAFVLPALQRLLQPAASGGRGPRVLVLTPTRELATQVTDAVQQLGRFTGLRAGSIVGGVPYFAQERLLRNPLDLLIATPGRLLDHMARGRVDFSRMELLVLDEADRMLDMGFVEDVEHIAQAAPKQRQTLLFSATLEGAVLGVAKRLLREPERVQVAGVAERHDRITQLIYQADGLDHKHALLGHLLNSPEVGQAIIFTATKRSAEELAGRLNEDGYSSAALHGDMKQGQRNRTVERLRRRHLKVLVATDVAARGLDIKGISHVFNFDLPMKAEDYVHRIGRTGRAGATGTAASLVGPQDWHLLSRIERLTDQRLERQVVPGLEPRRPEPRPGQGRPRSGPPRRGQSRFDGKRPGPGAGAGRSSGRPAGGDRPRTGDRPAGARPTVHLREGKSARRFDRGNFE